jgi:hypothetical protein
VTKANLFSEYFERFLFGGAVLLSLVACSLLQAQRFWLGTIFSTLRIAFGIFLIRIEVNLWGDHFELFGGTNEDKSNDRESFMQLRNSETGSYVKAYKACLTAFVVPQRNQLFLDRILEAWEHFTGRRGKNWGIFLDEEKSRLERFLTLEKELAEGSFQSFLRLQGPSHSSVDSLLAREADFYAILRNKLWEMFCHQIIWSSWQEDTPNFKSGVSSCQLDDFGSFEKTQRLVLKSMGVGEKALLQLHFEECSQISHEGKVSTFLVSPTKFVRG